MDDDTFAFLQESIAREVGLPEGWGDRLSGDSIAALRDDAAKLAKTLGIVEPESARARDDSGRYLGNDMNARIRHAAYGGNFVPTSGEPEPPVGRLGAGHGGVVPPPVKVDMSALIRQAAGR